MREQAASQNKRKHGGMGTIAFLAQYTDPWYEIASVKSYTEATCPSISLTQDKLALLRAMIKCSMVPVYDVRAETQTKLNLPSYKDAVMNKSEGGE